VRLVDDHEEVVREVVDQASRTLARLPSRERARVILDARAVPDLLQHFHVVLGPHTESLRFEELSLVLELPEPLRQLLANGAQPLLDPDRSRDEVLGRIDGGRVDGLDRVAGERIDDRDPFHDVPEELHAKRRLLVRRMDLDHVAAGTEGAALQIEIAARVLVVHELGEDVLASHLLADLDQ
jgi:hypothetical protein